MLSSNQNKTLNKNKHSNQLQRRSNNKESSSNQNKSLNKNKHSNQLQRRSNN